MSTESDVQEFIQEVGRLVPYADWRRLHPLTAEEIEKNRMEFLKKYGKLWA
jgi:hypothetical protein